MRKRVVEAVAAAALLAATAELPAYAAEWKQESSGWKYQKDDGSYATGWNWIDGKSYYFDSNGQMLADTTTPDGYTVNADGVWVVNGVVQTQGREQNVENDYKFGSERDADGGQWINSDNLTWKSKEGEIVVIGRGPKYSDRHPEVTDREYILKDTVWYLNGAEFMDYDDPNYWSSKGERKLLIHYADEYERLRTFVNSFDWIHSDELTRMTKVWEYVANGVNGNKYGTPSRDGYVIFPLLEQKVGVCSDFAEAYCGLAKLIGLECVTYKPAVNHEACLVKVNGQWLTIDPTSGWSVLSDVYPVDYETEYNRGEKEFRESDTWKKLQEEKSWQEKFQRGEISYEELGEKIDEIYSRSSEN